MHISLWLSGSLAAGVVSATLRLKASELWWVRPYLGGYLSCFVCTCRILQSGIGITGRVFWILDIRTEGTGPRLHLFVYLSCLPVLSVYGMCRV